MIQNEMVKTTFILFALLGPARLLAAEVAEVRPPPHPSRGLVAGRLGPSDAARLFSGKIPTLAHVRAKYGRRQSWDICTSKFNKLMSKDVEVKPIRANHATILANARAIGLSAKKVNKALATFLENQDRLPNQNFVTVIDFDRAVSQKRMFTIDLRTGQIKGYLTAAGRGSDPDGDGYATKFSNVDGTNASSLGCYVAYGIYDGTNGDSMVLHGMEKTNDNACDRSIVIHAAPYIGDGAARSFGCPAVKSSDRDEVFRRVSGGIICAEREGPSTIATKIFGGRKHRRHGSHRRWKKSRRHHARSYWRRHHAAY